MSAVFAGKSFHHSYISRRSFVLVWLKATVLYYTTNWTLFMCARASKLFDWDSSYSEGKSPKPTPLSHMRLSFNIHYVANNFLEMKRVGLFGVFQHPFCPKISKTEGKAFGEKKENENSHCRKKTNKGAFSPARYCMLYTNFQNVISELWKRYIQILKTFYPTCENVISEF